jgi:hypothetical protein
MPDGNVPYEEEAFRQERVKVRQYDRGIRDEASDGAVEARGQNRGRRTYDDNEATAPGKVCELCGSVITAGQQARLRPDGWWIHEACPLQ